MSRKYPVGIGNLTFNVSLPGWIRGVLPVTFVGQVDSLALSPNPSHKDCCTLQGEYPFPCRNREQMVCFSLAKDKTLRVAIMVCWTKIPRKNGFLAPNPKV